MGPVGAERIGIELVLARAGQGEMSHVALAGAIRAIQPREVITAVARISDDVDAELEGVEVIIVARPFALDAVPAFASTISAEHPGPQHAIVPGVCMPP